MNERKLVAATSSKIEQDRTRAVGDTGEHGVVMKELWGFLFMEIGRGGVR